MSHQRWFSGIPCMQARKHTSEGSRGGHKKGLMSSKNKKKSCVSILNVWKYQCLYLFHSQRESAVMLFLTSLSSRCKRAQKHRTVHTMFEHAGFLGKLTYFIHRVGSGQNPRILFRWYSKAWRGDILKESVWNVICLHFVVVIF